MFNPMQSLLVALGAEPISPAKAKHMGLVRKDGSPRTHRVTTTVAARFVAVVATVAILGAILVLR